jgi:hypothetical protein
MNHEREVRLSTRRVTWRLAVHAATKCETLCFGGWVGCLGGWTGARGGLRERKMWPSCKGMKRAAGCARGTGKGMWWVCDGGGAWLWAWRLVLQGGASGHARQYSDAVQGIVMVADATTHAQVHSVQGYPHLGHGGTLRPRGCQGQLHRDLWPR